MKLPSAKQLLEHSSATLKRFPYVIADAVIGTVAVIWWTELEFGAGYRWLSSILLASALGLPLLITIAIVAERRGLSTAGKTAVNLCAICLLGLYASILPHDLAQAPEVHLVRFFLLNIGLHLLVAFAPFTSRGELNGFWQFNKSLFLRSLTAALFTLVLYLGLFIALQAVHHLFNVEIDGNRYPQLWFLVLGIFNTWFFLAGVPADLALLESETRYLTGLKVFTQYILLPLVILYLLILYAYEIKIIVEWDWPKGWVSNLVLGFSVAGIFSLLLLWPIQEKAENAWVRVFARRYYLALIPLVVMLVLAIWKRISEYGVTENRYFVAVLGVWLLAMVLYFLTSRTKNIKIIPGSLCVIAFLTSVGPWSAFTVSEASQHGRLATFLQEGGANKTREELQNLPSGDQKEINSIVRYLTTMHGLDAVQDLVAADSSVMDSIARIQRGEQSRRIVEILGLQYMEEWEGPKGGDFAFSVDRSQPFSVGGYTFCIRVREFGNQHEIRNMKAGETSLIIESDLAHRMLTIRRLSPDSASVTVDLGPLITKLVDEYGSSSRQISPDKMAIEGSGSNMQWRVYVLSMRGEHEGEGTTMTSLEADLLLNPIP